MGPPGGGRNEVTDRFLRHMLIISIDSFDDNTLNKIFTTILDWHFAKGYDESVSKFSKVLPKNDIIKCFDLKKNIVDVRWRNYGALQGSHSQFPSNTHKITLHFFASRFFAHCQRNNAHATLTYEGFG